MVFIIGSLYIHLLLYKPSHFQDCNKKKWLIDERK